MYSNLIIPSLVIWGGGVNLDPPTESYHSKVGDEA